MKNKLLFQKKSGIGFGDYLKGFTIIELLVVVAIIGILAAIVIVNLEQAKIKQRDTQRKADLSVIASALEHYKADKKLYPLETTICDVNVLGTCLNELANYLNVNPVDPAADSTHKYQYKTNTNGTSFKARVLSEGITSSDGVDCLANPLKKKAGDYCDPATGRATGFQVSSDRTAAAWVMP